MWFADNYGLLVSIRADTTLDRAAPVLVGEDLEVEIEYEDCQISQFPVEYASVLGDDLKFYLGTKHTDCLAKDAT